MVLTGTGAAPPIPPDSRFRTLGSKHAAHCRFHLSPDQCCRSEGEQKRGHQSSPAWAHHAYPCPLLFPSASESRLPQMDSNFLPVHFGKTWSATPLTWALPVMLADNHIQAFSVASPTAMFSALLRTCDRRTAESGARGGLGDDERPSPRLTHPLPAASRACSRAHTSPTPTAQPASSRPPSYVQLLESPQGAVPGRHQGSSFGRT